MNLPLILLVLMAMSGWMAAVWLGFLWWETRKQARAAIKALEDSVALHEQSQELMARMLAFGKHQMDQHMTDQLVEMDFPGPPN